MNRTLFKSLSVRTQNRCFRDQGISSLKCLKAFLILICAAVTSFSVTAQTMDLPITFDDASLDYELAAFGGGPSNAISAMVGTDPVDPTNSVLSITKDVGSDCWAGTTVFNNSCLANPIPFGPGNMTMQIDVYSPAAGIPFLLKVENCGNGGIFSELIAVTTVANTWETLTFDFSMGCVNPPDLNNVYDKISVFPNFACNDFSGCPNPAPGIAFNDMPFFVDNIMMAPVPLELPINFDNAGVDYNLEAFGQSTSATIATDPVDPNNSVLSIIKDAGADCWSGTTVGADPECLASPIQFPAGSMIIEMDVYSPAVGATILLKIENCTNGGISSEVLVQTTVANAWETLTFDFSAGCPAPPNMMANTYDQISIFPNFTCTPDVCGNPNPGAGATFNSSPFFFDNIIIAEPATESVTCTGNVPIENLANGLDYTIVSDASGNVSVTATVVDNPAGLVGFFGGPGNPISFPDANGTFTVNLTGQADGSAFVMDWFFNWAAGGQGNSETVKVTVNGPCEVPDTDVTFCVDLSCFPEAPLNPSVFGNFTTPPFDINQNLLSDPDGDGIWCATVGIPCGSYEYLFFDNNQGAEDFEPGASCTTTNFGFTNRLLEVGTTSPQMEIFGWESCGLDCVTPIVPADFPLTFDDMDVDYDLVDFGGAVTVFDTDPNDPDNVILCSTKTVGAATFAGTAIGNSGLENPIPLTATETIITVDVLSPAAGITVLLKLENSNGGPTTEVTATTTVANEFETLVFDFSNDPNFNPDNVYDRVVIFFDFGNVGTGQTFCFDNIMLCDQTLPPMIECPDDVTVDCDASMDPADTGMATATDLCSEPDVTFADVSGQGVAGCDQYTYTITRTWTATDNLGMTATCEQMIMVQDTTAPVITCPADVSGSCTDSTLPTGTGEATATDNCSSEAEIMITFTDVSNQGMEGCGASTFSISRTWMATDACGNTATCVQTIAVADSQPPVVTCPADQMMVACDANALPIATTIEEFIAIGGTVSDDCSGLMDLSLNVFNNPPSLDMLDFCPEAPEADRTLTRTYQITDICGNVATCEQTFVFAPSSADPVITAVPQDQTVDCVVNAIPQLALFVAEGDCSEITYTVSDPVSSGTAGCSGSTIQYTYTATDECGRSVSTVQTYTLENEGPQFVAFTENCVIDCPADLAARQAIFDDYAERANISSGCSGASLSMTNNFNQNGFINQNCLNPTVAIDNAIAFQIVTFTATDACGRSGTETALVVIVDTEGPEFTNGASSGLASCDDADLQGGFTEWANAQLSVLAATDGCSGGAVSFSYAPLTANVDCSSGTAITEVAFTATDACGNATVTMANYVIVDNGPGEPAMATVSGTLRTEEFETIEAVDVTVDGFMNNMMTTTSDGYYHFDLLESQNYAISPSRNDNPLNGVTTYDLILLGQHLLEINTLDSPYKLIAADVNESGSITTLDLIKLRRLILLIDDEFDSGKSWTFVDAGYVFPQPTNPFATTYPTIYNINSLTTGTVADFVGVKLGDLNASANSVLLQSGDTRSSDGTLNIRMEDEQLKAGQTYDLAFTAQDFKNVAGFQFTLDFAADYLEVVDYEDSELSQMSADNFGFTRASQGQITVSWNDVNAVSLSDNATLFTMSFTALKDGQLSEVLAINSSVTVSEAYQADLRKNVALDFGKQTTGAAGYALQQNQPNPFAQETTIGFQLPETTEATLTVYDVSGRIIYTTTNTYDAGVHQVMMDKADLGATGVLYYQLSTPEFTDTKKMIVLK